MPPTAGPVTPPYDDYGRRRSSSVLPLDHSEAVVLKKADESRPPVILSPPPTPKASRRNNNVARLAQRLRSNSGLSLHANEDALRRYTDYNPDGSSRSPLFTPVNWQGGSNGEKASRRFDRRSLHIDYGPPETTLPIPDYFSQEVFHMVLNNPSAAHRLLRYAQRKGCGENMAYLMKVSIYATFKLALLSVWWALYLRSTSSGPRILRIC